MKRNLIILGEYIGGLATSTAIFVTIVVAAGALILWWIALPILSSDADRSGSLKAPALKRLAITLDWAQQAHKKVEGRKIVYAPACYLDDETLDQYNMKFVSIPYNLFERQ